MFRVLDKNAETRSSQFQSLLSFSEHEFYFVFRGLFHCYSRAMNFYVHHGFVHSRAHHSTPDNRFVVSVE